MSIILSGFAMAVSVLCRKKQNKGCVVLYAQMRVSSLPDEQMAVHACRAPKTLSMLLWVLDGNADSVLLLHLALQLLSSNFAERHQNHTDT